MATEEQERAARAVITAAKVLRELALKARALGLAVEVQFMEMEYSEPPEDFLMNVRVSKPPEVVAECRM